MEGVKEMICIWYTRGHHAIFSTLRLGMSKLVLHAQFNTLLAALNTWPCVILNHQYITFSDLITKDLCSNFAKCSKILLLCQPKLSMVSSSSTVSSVSIVQPLKKINQKKNKQTKHFQYYQVFVDQLKVFLVSFEKKNIYTKANDKKNGYIKNKLLLSFEVDEKQREGKKDKEK